MQESTLLSPPVQTKPRLGFLGVGWIGRNRMEALARTGIAEISAICDNASPVVNELQTQYPGAHCSGQLTDLLAGDLDGIVISTPSALHAQQSIAALEKGIAVFCQKPLARNTEETRQIIDIARQQNKLVGVDFSYRYTEGIRQVKALLEAGELGEIFGANLVFHNAYGPDKPWYYNPALAGGGCLTDLGVHLVDLLLWLTGDTQVSQVCGQLFAGGKPIRNAAAQVEDYAAVQLQLSSGVAAQLACSWNLAAGRDAVIEVTFYGTKGGVSFTNVNGSFYDFATERFSGTSRQQLSGPPDDWGGRALIDWAQKLARGEGFAPESEQYIAVAQVLDVVYGNS
jgi:predicted dehydrogenase